MRTQGTFNFGANLEVKKDAPLDSRVLVPSYADLILDETWKDSDGNAWTYPGMLVTCLDRPGKLYQLTEADYTKTANWTEIGAEVDLSGYALKKEIPNQLNWASAGNDVEMNLGYIKDGMFVDLRPLKIELATQFDAGLMSIEDKANLDRMEVEKGGLFSVDYIDGVMFKIPKEDGSNAGYEYKFLRNGQISTSDNVYDLPKSSGTIALQSEVEAKADASALTALSEKVDAKADSGDLPTAIEETEINDICK